LPGLFVVSPSILADSVELLCQLYLFLFQGVEWIEA
jgi:hypothetical protein